MVILIIEVLLLTNIDKPLLYLYNSENEDIQKGNIVIVPLRSRLCTGIIIDIQPTSNITSKKLKYIKQILPLKITDNQFNLYTWISEYYINDIKEVFNIALPSVIKLIHRRKNQNKVNEYIYRSIIDNNKKYQSLPLMTGDQLKAYNEIIESFKCKKCTLLYGVTGSGKTIIYAHLIQKYLDDEKHILILVPEIFLATHLAQYLSNYFNFVVYHSKFSDHERLSIWSQTKNISIIIGTRSSVFLPFDKKLSLIIVDEEHEQSYKQMDSKLRYNGRDVAIYMSSIYNANVLLCSATPSIESFYNTKINKYNIVSLGTRYNDYQLPNISLLSYAHFTNKIIKSKIEEHLSKGEQVMIFQNRRGYARGLLCKKCSTVIKCKYCSVNLVMHLNDNRLKCHYCGKSYPILKYCLKCGNTDLLPIGYGTEHIEEDLKTIFPNYKTQRLDTDIIRSRKDADKIIRLILDHQVDIIIGTQMITKGVSFNNVNLVIVMDIDRLMCYPDYRASEKLFQLLTQVSGRAGRATKHSEVIIQTFNNKYDIFKQVINNDYESLYNNEIHERKKYKYPPFVRLMKIICKDKNTNNLCDFVRSIQDSIQNDISLRSFCEFIGVEKPMIYKIQNNYYVWIWLKLYKHDINTMNKTKQRIKNIIDSQINSTSIYIIDIDPI